MENATHKHKRAGAVIVLRSMAELAEVQISTSGERFWVKRSDLTELAVGAAEAPTPRKKRAK